MFLFVRFWSSRNAFRPDFRFSSSGLLAGAGSGLQIRFSKVVAILFVRFWSSRNSFRPDFRFSRGATAEERRERRGERREARGEKRKEEKEERGRKEQEKKRTFTRGWGKV